MPYYDDYEVRNDAPYLLQRATEYLIEQVIHAEYPELKADAHIPTVQRGGPGADTITQVVIDWRGRGKVTSDPSQDPPQVGLLGNARTWPVRSITASYSVTFQEGRSASQMGMDVSSEKALGAMEMVKRESNRIAYLGDIDTGLFGLFTFPLLPKIVSPINFNDPALDPTVALRYLNDWANVLYDVITQRTFKADACIMPSRVMTYLNTTYRNSHSDVTLMELFRKSNPHITFVDDAAEANEAGFGGVPAMIFYKKDPRHVQRFIPVLAEQLIHRDSQTTKEVLIHQRDAGVAFSRLSAVVIEGVFS